MRALAPLACVLLALVPRAAPPRSCCRLGRCRKRHASIDSDDDCASATSRASKVVAGLCLACHKELGAEITAGRGLHGQPYKGKACEELSRRAPRARHQARALAERRDGEARSRADRLEARGRARAGRSVSSATRRRRRSASRSSSARARRAARATRIRTPASSRPTARSATASPSGRRSSARRSITSSRGSR